MRKPVAAPPPRPRWLFRLAAAVLAPVLVLGALEGALRLAGYGYSTRFFEELRIGGEDCFVNNDKVGLRFFPPELVRSPVALRLEARKPAGTVRIFVLGESAAMGDPEAAFGAWRYLEILLRERFPERRFEVVNVSMTAINSHAILPIARECARRDGDLWIIYMGNNEMVGPYGAATIFGPQAPPLGLIRLNLALQRTRVGQLLVSLGRRFKGTSANYSSWAGMQMFAGNRVGPADHRREVVYRNFQRNLEDILQAGLGSGAGIVLNTVAVNLRDCPPFASLSNTNLPPSQSAELEAARAAASLAASQGNFAEAARQYESAAKTDTNSADLQFQWGQCLLQLTNAAAAAGHLQLACDFDALPFRTDSRLNQIIRQTADRLPGPNLRLLDAPAALGAASPTRLCGQESFYEHVHFNFDGNYRLARAWADQAETLLRARFPDLRARPAGAGWATQETCEQRLGLSDWNRRSVLQEVERRLEQPPLSQQPNNSRRLAEVRDWENRLSARMDPAAAAKARADFQDAVARAPADFYVHENYADFLQAVQDANGALAEWRKVLELIPHNFLPYFSLGRVLASQDQAAEAETNLLQAVTLRPDFAEGWLALAQLHSGQAKPESLQLALEDIGRARQLRPNDPRVYYQYGRAYSKLNRRADAIASYAKAVELKPDYWEARAEWGGHLGLDGKLAEARKQFEEVVRLKPEFAMGHLNLGVALMKLGQLDDAQRQFEETLRLDPKNTLARTCLAQIQELKRK
jgi:tetratricopeptide (TPR) repeat protein